MKWAGGASAFSHPCSRRVAGPARDDEAPASSAGHPSIAPTSPRATSAPAEASGADAGALAHWSQPSGRTSSSSGISTTAALGLPVVSGAGEVGGAATATAVVAVVTAAACYGSTSIAGCGSATAAACCTSATTCSSSVVVAPGCGSKSSAPKARRVPPGGDDCVRPQHLGRRKRGARWAPPCEREGKGVRPQLTKKHD
jgi:hypothetical protein